eukprot:TRINITY_DN1060_c0_g1_i3.p1 TRINITY_DN1060_c0_g1~~TRINITY_DN1060_c0_g1_i3.p1  ORF type:complete len:282 (-),score=41.33 TRINITY_DN1060_c0_g1_i3:34-879(-)
MCIRDRAITLSDIRPYSKTSDDGSSISMAEIMGFAPSTTSAMQSSPPFPLKCLYLTLFALALLSGPCILHSVTLYCIVFSSAITLALYSFALYYRARYMQLLYHSGALYSEDVKRKWHFHRLLCPVFLHGDPIHLGFNVVTMVMVCIPFEKRLSGSYWFIAFYLVPGIAGNLLTAVVHTKGIAVGASTSLFGVLAAFEVHSRLSPHPVFYPTSWQYWLMIIVFHVYLFAFGGKYIKIDPWGHLGGFVMGALIGLSKFLYWYVWFSVPVVFIVLFLILFLRK